MSIDVIIPSRQRLGPLQNCLRFLSKQTVLPHKIIIVENNDVHTYKNVKTTFPKLPIFLYLEPRKGKSKARNAGMRQATGDIMAFLDDDCEPAKNWIKQIANRGG